MFLNFFKFLTVVFLLVVFAFAQNSFAQTVTAFWSFEGVTTTNTGTTPIISVGSPLADGGALTAGSAFTGLHASTSTVWSNPAGNGSVKSVSSNYWSVGDYYQFLFSTTGYSNLYVTWDQTGSGTGPRDFKVQYSTDGTNFTDATGTNSTYSLVVSNWSSTQGYAEHRRTLDLSSVTALNNQATVYIRLVQTTTTSIGGGIVATAGTGRVDNFTAGSSLSTIISSFPFIETFETTSPTYLNWTQKLEVGNGLWSFLTGSNGVITTAFEGTRNARFVSRTGTASPITKLISPVMNLTSLTAPRVVFYYGQPNYTGDQNETKVYYSSDAGSTWNEIANYTADVSTWTQATLTLPNKSATYQIAFEGINNYGYANVIDFVTVEESPSCLPPSNLAASNITTTSADIGWLGAATVDIDYGAPGHSAGTGTIISDVVTNPYPLGGLSANTSYDVYVRQKCGVGNYSSWAGPLNFNTQCATISIFPLTENFDGTWVGLPAAPSCWKVINANSDGYTWRQGNTYITPTHSEPYAAVGMGNTNDYMITPAIDLTGINVRVKWWDKVESASYVNSYKVLVSTTTPDIASFTNDLGTYNCANTAWTEHILDLSSFNGQTIYIAFYQFASGATYYGFGIDDVTVEELPSCLEPNSLTATNITLNSVDIGWAGAATVDIDYGTPGHTAGTGTIVSGVSTNPYPLSPLSGATSYDVYVRQNCGVGNYSAWVGPLNFATLCGPIVSFPYTEGFEGTAFPPICWTNSLWVQSLYGGAHSGLEWAYSNTNGSLLTTPGFTLSGNYRLKYWYRVESSAYPQDMNVLLSTDGINFTTTLKSYVGITNTIYIEEIVDLSTYSGQTVYIRFNGLSGTGGFDYGICVDDVTVEEATFGNLSGIVSNCFAPNPVLEGVTVSIGASSTTTNVSGYYEFLNIPSGTYSITASLYGYASTTVPGVLVTTGTTTQNICLDELLFAPSNLQASVTGQDVQLTWNAPPNVLLQWDDNVNSNSIGVDGPLVFDVAHRWPVADLTDLGVDGKYLKVVRFFPSEAAATYTIKVWQGANAGSLTEVHSQAVPSPTIGAWNEVTLSPAVEIDGTQELWIGYNINTTVGFPAGCDATLEYPGKGNMIYSTDFGGAWVELTALNAALTYDWNIAGYVYNTLTDGEESVIALAEDNDSEGKSLANKDKREKPDLSNGVLLKTGRTTNNRSDADSKLINNRSGAIDATLLGYDVYKDDILVANNTSDLFYNDNDLPLGVYSYKVVAVYSEGESTPAGPLVVQIVPTPGTIPFTENFEGSWPGNWNVVNGTQTNQWFVGTVAVPYAGNKSAYVSNDAGVSYAYTTTISSVVHMYRDITFSGGSGGYELKFWYKGVAEFSYDFLKVYVVDTDVIPTEGVQLSALNQVGTEYNNQLNYVEATILLPSTLTGSTKRLVFSWKNDGIDGEQPPISFDNISLIGLALVDAEVTSIQRPNLTESLGAVFNPQVTITNNGDQSADIPVYAEIWTSEGTFFNASLEDQKPVAEGISKEAKSLNGIEITNHSNYTPPTMSPDATILSEGIEGGVIPPAGWTLESTNASFTWKVGTVGTPHSGTYWTDVEYDPALVPQDEKLISPVIDLSIYVGQTIKLSFWWSTSYYWFVNPYDNGDFTVDISTDGGATWPTNLFNEDALGTFVSYTWYDANLGTHIDLTAYAGQSNVKLRFRYLAIDAAQCSVDDILIYTEYTPTLVYSDNVTVTGLGSGSSQVVNFDPWTATPEGNYSFKAYTDLIGDLVPANNILTREFVVGGATTFPLTVETESGWNMVSIPGLHPVDQNVGTWWAYKEVGSKVYKFDSGYLETLVATPGEGYWMKNSVARTYNTGEEWPSGGIQIVAHAPIPGNTGWNMIGGYENPATIANITTDPPNQKTGIVYGYLSGYTTPAQMTPGDGYWVKLLSNADIIIPETLAKDGKAVEYFPENWGRIILTDATGVSYTLYGVKGEVDLNTYEMPPAPPTGMYDIRFGSNRIAEDINSTIKTIEMSGITYPLTVRVEGMDIRLMDETGKTVNVNLKDGEDIVINDATIQKLMVSGELIPAVYALEQNYPNPFNPSTVIEFSLPENVGNVKLSIYNALGEKVAELVNTALTAGKYQYQWNAQNVATGMYIYELRTDKFVSVKKMLLLK